MSKTSIYRIEQEGSLQTMTVFTGGDPLVKSIFQGTTRCSRNKVAMLLRNARNFRVGGRRGRRIFTITREA